MTENTKKNYRKYGKKINKNPERKRTRIQKEHEQDSGKKLTENSK